jgi:hypothetical protein
MNLYDFAALARRAIIYIALGIVAAIILYFLYKLAANIYLTLNPPPEPSPTTGFGKLPKLRLASLEIKGSPTYILETPTGQLPQFDDRANVVAMKPIQPTLLGEQKARELSKSLDFGGEGELSDDKKFLFFQDPIDQRALVVNVTNQNFLLATTTSRISSLPKGSAPTGAETIKEAQGILTRLGLLKFGFETGNQTTSFRIASPQAISPSGSISEAHFTGVNFFRSLTGVDDQNYQIMPIDPKMGLIQVGVTTGLKPEINNILGITYSAQEAEIDKTRVETYPLGDVMADWEEIKSGQGTAYVGSAEDLSTIQINSITLEYFDDAVHQDYLQPIYVFSGVAKTVSNKEVEFVAYSQAVSQDWIEE